ncbi:hypothetical protein [Ferrovibrio terrae]|uniref:hypothetical protein n=1 Tax=Ferrovibrio terrae TaxID=2594003 RepID=UPI0031380578
MTLERFIDLLDAYGADLDLWPQSEQSAATALLAALPEAREAQRRAATADALLFNAALPMIEPSDALRQRVLAQVAMLPAASPASNWRGQVLEALALLFPTGRSLPQFAALALAVAIGISAGFANIGFADAQESDLVSVQIASATPLLSED